MYCWTNITNRYTNTCDVISSSAEWITTELHLLLMHLKNHQQLSHLSYLYVHLMVYMCVWLMWLEIKLDIPWNFLLLQSRTLIFWGKSLTFYKCRTLTTTNLDVLFHQTQCTNIVQNAVTLLESEIWTGIRNQATGSQCLNT